jgi:hypothetical protein
LIARNRLLTTTTLSEIKVTFSAAAFPEMPTVRASAKQATSLGIGCRETRQGLDPGGLVVVDGIKNGPSWLDRLHHVIDWTDGCVAVTNSEIDEMWAAVPDGTKIVLKPSALKLPPVTGGLESGSSRSLQHGGSQAETGQLRSLTLTE